MNQIINAGLVSVIIPTYNHGQYLGRALQTVLDQTYLNWEVIVIDNHSTDDTDEVIARFSDRRITYIKIHNNGVIATSRNKGVLAAKGEWLAFLDSDDWWTKDKLEKCLELKGEADFIYHPLNIVTDKQNIARRGVTKSWQLDKPIYKELMINGNGISTSSVVVKKIFFETAGGFDESRDIVAAEDLDAWIRISLLTNKFKFIPVCLGFYLLSSGGVSRRDMSVPTGLVCKKYMYLLSNKEKNKTLGFLSYMSSLHALKKNDYKTAKLKAKLSIRFGGIKVKTKSIILLLILFFKA